MRRLLMLCLVGLVGSIPANAKVSAIPIDELIDQANVIVIAKVTNLAEVDVPFNPDRPGSIVFADAIAQRTLKGTIPKDFRFRAQGGFICSETGAVKDELAMFFLYRDPQGAYAVMAFGNGRMAVWDKDGKSYVTATGVIVFPKDAPMTEASPSMDYGSQPVELTYVETRIRDVLRAHAPADVQVAR